MGATTVVSGRHVEELRKTADQISAEGGRCEPQVCDVTDLSSVEGFAKRVLTTFNAVDILVNNAWGRWLRGPLHNYA